LTGLAKTESPDVVVVLDGDCSDGPSDLPLMLAPIIDRAPDIAVGARFSGKSNPGALPWHESLGNRLAAGLIRLLHGVNVSDKWTLGAARFMLTRIVGYAFLRRRAGTPRPA